jgi:hypothetical protein
VNYHPWASTPEAINAARKAVSIPMAKMGRKAAIIGRDELESQALVILTECALESPEPVSTACARCGKPLEHVRRNAKFCSSRCRNTYNMRVRRGQEEAVPPNPLGHIGSMHSWDEGRMAQFAVQEVGMRLCNYVTTRHDTIETPSSDALERMDEAA